MNLILAITIFFSGGLNSVFLACYREAGSAEQVCESPTGAGGSNGSAVFIQHTFKGLKPGTAYEFTYKENGVESHPMAYTTTVDSECPEMSCPTLPASDPPHPNGQSWKNNWCAAREAVCLAEDVGLGIYTCRYPFLEECRGYVQAPHK